ncbi:hypothetical protein CSC94_12745 [Zhengella mangrovi]|uniref:Uncharacterized protein n=1 Tax=Zhengella mangrovi TaxID=1982044 RepID=A0A2G1QM66_9HYPH|nr:hypothetical protein [Zhengella mangrovi]PHP66551.1 hypothetical protein CSC94_12745 [Zhengella mangrovi]
MAEKTIGAETYRTQPLPAKRAFALYVDLMRMLSDGANRFVPHVADLTGEDAGPIAEVLSLAAIGDMLRNTPTMTLIDLLERIVSAAEVQRPSGYAQVNIDEEFTGRLPDVIPLAEWVLKEQFGDFFPVSALAIGLRKVVQVLASAK